MRILTLYYTHKPGGFCGRMYRLLNALAQQNSVYYLCLDQPPEELDSQVTFQKIPFPTKQRSGVVFWLLFLLWAPLYAAWASRKIKPEAYLAFSPFYSAVLSLSKRLYGKKLDLISRSVGFRADQLLKSPAMAKLMGVVDRIGLKEADRIIFMTEAMRADYEAWLGQPLPCLGVVPNNISPAAKLPFKAIDSRGVITIARLDKGKNIKMLLDAWKLVEHDNSDLRLKIIGDGPELEALRKQAARLKNAELLGWQSETEVFLEEAALLVHPSLLEGVSNAVTSALAAGKAVLLSKIPEHCALTGAESPLLFELESVEELAADILAFFDEGSSTQNELLRESGELAKRLDFDWEARMLELLNY